eukprot:TRINITY_DN138_c1_g1_i17.p1 TRINITY_DN138_c1_g1~~TRINITY_DN138_c1_g1_i17.p1  ORF type:complete len:127 (-),score=1.33 TRINITY_DN138_c1_g1_i17:70-450(-)
MVESHQMQDRRVQVMDVHAVLHRIHADVVGRSVSQSPGNQKLTSIPRTSGHFDNGQCHAIIPHSGENRCQRLSSITMPSVSTPQILAPHFPMNFAFLNSSHKFRIPLRSCILNGCHGFGVLDKAAS